MKHIKPVPYYSITDDLVFTNAARRLRVKFQPNVNRLLSTVHYSGFTQNFIVEYVAKHKKEYPYFIRTDIAKFYPTVEPFRLVAQTQIAWRDLNNLQFVPHSFTEEYLPVMSAWMRSLPAVMCALPKTNTRLLRKAFLNW